MRRRRSPARRLVLAAVVTLVAGWPALASAGSLFRPAGPAVPVPRRLPPPAVASGLRSDTVFVPLPPVYSAPAGTFVPLPAGGTPPPPPPPDWRDRVAGTGREPRWIPGRLEVITGIDESGRVGHALQQVPGRFEP